jgi:CRP-like cAMP-binding protein
MSSSFDRPEIPATGIMADLDEEDRRLLGDYGEFLPVHPEQLLIREGGEQDSLYFVISGLLHVHTDTKDKRTFVARVGAGETLGEVNLFDPAAASASVTAKEFSQVWKANRADLEEFAKGYPAAAARLMAGLLSEMSKRLRRMNEKLATREAEAAFQSFWS